MRSLAYKERFPHKYFDFVFYSPFFVFRPKLSRKCLRKLLLFIEIGVSNSYDRDGSNGKKEEEYSSMRGQALKTNLKRNYIFYALFIPVFVYYLIFHYKPLLGVVIM